MTGSRKPTKAEHRIESTAGAPAEQRGRIALAAYFKAEARGFAPGHELEDWLAAEQEISRRKAGAGKLTG